MRTIRNNQAGFEAIGIMVAVLFVAVIGFAGYKVMHMNKAADSQSASASSQMAAPATIRTQADLTQTSKALDASGSQSDNSLDDSSLDADMNTML